MLGNFKNVAALYLLEPKITRLLVILTLLEHPWQKPASGRSARCAEILKGECFLLPILVNL